MSDQERLCQGREYTCSCGYDKERDDLQAELLAILKECADFIQPFNRAEDLLDRVDSVIAKAEKAA